MERLKMAKYLLIQTPDSTDISLEDFRTNLGGKIFIIGETYEVLETHSLESLEEKLGRFEKREKQEQNN